MTALPLLDNTRARALFLHRHGLAEPPSGLGKGRDLQGVIDDLGFVQLDSISTVARAHHMILHARRLAYRPKNLQLLHDRDRSVFEHWTHDASVIPVRFFPHWRLRFLRDEEKLASRWRKWGREFAHKTDEVLRHIADHGPCSSAELGTDETRPAGGWWNWHPSKAALEYLWRTGRLSVARRDGFRKVYDLTENVIPRQHLRARYDEAESVEWACASALDRLGFATSGEIAAFWGLVTPEESKAWVVAALDRGEVLEVEIAQSDGRRRRSLIRPRSLDENVPSPTGRLRILSPFDPALRDRKRAERLFGFSYRIEVFVPQARRTYGYYVFPILEGDRLVGRIDMKADRDRDRLDVKALWPEQGVSFGRGRTASLKTALGRTARLAGLSGVDFSNGWLR